MDIPTEDTLSESDPSGHDGAYAQHYSEGMYRFEHALSMIPPEAEAALRVQAHAQLSWFRPSLSRLPCSG